MSVTPASIKAFATELTSLDDDDDVQPAIDMAERRTNRTQWGVKADDGVTYLVCHMLTLLKKIRDAGSASGVQGPITSKRAGPVGLTYGDAGASQAAFTDGWYTLSTYGAAYVNLRGTLVMKRECF